MLRRGATSSATREVLRRTHQAVSRRDLALASAGGSFYGALAVVPSLLAAIAVAGLLLGDDAVRRYGDALASTLPEAMGADTGARRMVEAGLALSPLGVLLAIGMGSAYGEGLSRSLHRFAPLPDESARPPAWWLRAMTLPLLGLAPLMLSGLLIASPSLAGVNSGSGPAGVLLASYLSLNLVWVLTWLPLTWTFRVVGPGRPPWRSAFVGAVVTGAFVSGFIQGFLLFLALPVDLGRPFGGLVGVGLTSALLLWLWVLHVVVCIGYAMTWAIAAVTQGNDTSVPAGWRGTRPRAGTPS